MKRPMIGGNTPYTRQIRKCIQNRRDYLNVEPINPNKSQSEYSRSLGTKVLNFEEFRSTNSCAGNVTGDGGPV